MNCRAILVPLSAFALMASAMVAAQEAPKPDAQSSPQIATRVNVADDYVIGAEDVLTVVFWQDADLSRDVVVRPDGNISLPLLNDIRAAGLTPEQLREKVAASALRYVEDATVTVIVKEVKSPKVFITGEVIRPGLYPLNAPTTVLQLIAIAGGLQEYADAGEISVVRTEGGRTRFFPFNYKDMMKQKNPQQNIMLKSGDTVVVP
jgi:polysaccharide export outer membrane protein